MRTITLDPAHARNYEPAFRAAVAQQPDDDYEIVMQFFSDGVLTETWTWRPSQQGWVEQREEGQDEGRVGGRVGRLQITWARKASVQLLEVWCDESGGASRWVARWKDANGEVQDKVLDARDKDEADDEAEGFIFRMAYL